MGKVSSKIQSIFDSFDRLAEITDEPGATRRNPDQDPLLQQEVPLPAFSDSDSEEEDRPVPEFYDSQWTPETLTEPTPQLIALFRTLPPPFRPYQFEEYFEYKKVRYLINAYLICNRQKLYDPRDPETIRCKNDILSLALQRDKIRRWELVEVLRRQLKVPKTESSGQNDDKKKIDRQRPGKEPESYPAGI